MLELFKQIYYYYIRATWYMGIAKGEITKPLQFWNETLLILIYLKTIGIEPSINWTIFVYCLIYLAFIVIGKILVLLRVVSLNNRLANSQNPEILYILEKVNKIESMINEIILKNDNK